MTDRSIAALVDQLAVEIDAATMAQDPDMARTAAHQQVIEANQKHVRMKARAVLRRVWSWERERAEASGSTFRAAFARAFIADLDAEDAA